MARVSSVVSTGTLLFGVGKDAERVCGAALRVLAVILSRPAGSDPRRIAGVCRRTCCLFTSG